MTGGVFGSTHTRARGVVIEATTRPLSYERRVRETRRNRPPFEGKAVPLSVTLKASEGTRGETPVPHVVESFNHEKVQSPTLRTYPIGTTHKVQIQGISLPPLMTTHPHGCVRTRPSSYAVTIALLRVN